MWSLSLLYNYISNFKYAFNQLHEQFRSPLGLDRQHGAGGHEPSLVFARESEPRQ